ncbi:MAG TPA: WD40 repeat domain-containing protein [Sulfurimonas sp.]|nr:WD40 repeat domain-containing protein [Sulfurimonas sp.]
MKLLSIVFFFFLSNTLLAQKLEQVSLTYVASGSVSDMLIKNEKLFVATNASCIDIFTINNPKKIKSIYVEKIVDFMGKKSNSKVYSVDVYKDKIAILSQASKGFRRVHIYENGKLHLLISNKNQLYISKVRFLDENTLLLGLLSNEIISFDISKNVINYLVQVSQSKFSDFALSEDKSEVVIADESGDLKLLDTKNGLLKETFSGQNLDNVFKVDYKNGVIATAGQDRRVVVYNVKSNVAYYKKSSFLIYAVGLSPSAKLVAYASNEDNNVRVFNSSTQDTVGNFVGNKMTLTKILFINEKEFLVSSDDKTINLFKIRN